MTQLKLGSSSVSDVKLGSTQVQKLYLGSTQIWSSYPTPGFVSTGGGSSYYANSPKTTSWTHSVTAGNLVIIIIGAGEGNPKYATNLSASVDGGDSVSLVTSIPIGLALIKAYSFVPAATRTATVTMSTSAGNPIYIVGNSFEYTGVTTASVLATAGSASGGNPSMSANISGAAIAVQAFMLSGHGGYTPVISSYSGADNTRYTSNAPSPWKGSLVVGDSLGAGHTTVSYSCTSSNTSASWAGGILKLT